MPLENLSKEVVKDLLEYIGRSQIPEAATEVTKSGVPRVLEEATTAEARKVAATGLPTGIRERATGVDFPGPTSVRQAVRATADAEQTSWADRGRGIKEFMGSFFDEAPGVPTRLKSMAHDTRVRGAIAEADAKFAVRDALAPIKDDHFNKITKLSDFMKLADRIATVRGEVAAGLRDPLTPTEATGATLSQLEQSFRNTAGELSKMPDVLEAHKNVRKLLDDVFQNMVDRGYIEPTRYREAYTPVQQLEEIARGLQQRGASRVGGSVLPATLERGVNSAFSESNLVPLLKDYLSDYYRKTAEDGFFMRVFNDPNLNLTRHFEAGARLPKGIVSYIPGPGLPGYAAKRKEMVFFDGVTRALFDGAGAGKIRGSYNGVGVVVPESVANLLTSFKPPSPDEFTGKVFKAGQAWSRAMTVYNPRNTSLNVFSDLFLALLGMPGEKNHALGILRFEPAAIRAAFKGAFGKDPEIVNIGGKRLNIYELAEKQGITGSTLISDLGGLPIDQELAKFAEQTTMKPHERIGDFMSRVRQAVEASPRIAAGMEALARTGDINEFGRIGRNITLPYGYGAPAAARNPFMRFLTPFIQFTGLATKRIYELSTHADSRGRTLTALAAIPTAMWMWNVQNSEYKKVENSLKEFERDAMHIIFPDPEDPGKPLRDKNGNPVVMRVRYFVPEEIMRNFGFGNLPARVGRVAVGRTTPVEFMDESRQNASENLAFQFGPVSAAISGLTGRSLLTGQKNEGLGSALASATPQTRAVSEIVKAMRGGDVGEVARTAVEQTAGIGFSRSAHRGKVLKDTDLVDARRALSDAQKELAYARTQRDKVRIEDAKKKLIEARANYRRLQGVVRNDRRS